MSHRRYRLRAEAPYGAQARQPGVSNPLALAPAQRLYRRCERAGCRARGRGGATMGGNITVPKEQIAAFCRRRHIRRLSLFGSVLRDDFRSDSDIDVLVEFEPGHVPGLAFFAMEAELSDILGRNVELSTAAFLSRYIRDSVLANAQVQYDAR